jgi:hypothetical protein
VLLRYAEGADKLRQKGKHMESVAPFVQTVTDNKQRVMDFLLTQNILIDGTNKDQGHLEELVDFQVRKQIFGKTKTILGAFWE